MIALFVAVLVALGVSFLCSFVEAALLSLTPANVAELTKANPEKGKIWHGFKANIGMPISVILLLNTTAHTIGASIAGAQVDAIWGERYVWIFSLVFTYLMLQFTEILPKTLGVRYRINFAVAGAVPLAWAVHLLGPILGLVHAINRIFEPASTSKSGEKEQTIEEIVSLAAMARMSKQIGRHQEKIIATASHLSGITARQVMIPATEVMHLSTASTIREAFLMAHNDLHTRYPVRDAMQPERFVGYINFKELVYFMSTNPTTPNLVGIIRPLNTVAPETTAAELLKLFVDQYNHMMVVTEEDGTGVGIVTLEDVMEEMVGEIEDEFDRMPTYIHILQGGVALAGGGALWNDIAARLDVEGGPEGETVGDWLAATLGPGFNRGDVAQRDGLEIMVRRIKRGRIFDTQITPIL